MIKSIFAIITIFSTTLSYSQEFTKQQIDKWLNNPNAPLPVVKKQRKINEGNLVFLDRIKHKFVMHSENKIQITKSSLQDGWVNLNQCYKQLDAFPRVQVVYQYKNIRNLKVHIIKKMDSAKVQGKSVQLVNVKKGATLCVSAQVQSLEKTNTGYQLKNGPFRRKFLDGYFPLRVSVSVSYPATLIKLAKVLPDNKAATKTKGMLIQKSKSQVRLDTTFEGVLNTQLVFTTTGSDSAKSL